MIQKIDIHDGEVVPIEDFFMFMHHGDVCLFRREPFTTVVLFTETRFYPRVAHMTLDPDNALFKYSVIFE